MRATNPVMIHFWYSVFLLKTVGFTVNSTTDYTLKLLKEKITHSSQ